MHRSAVLVLTVLAAGCSAGKEQAPVSKPAPTPASGVYAEVTLSTDLSVLTENERKMLPLLTDACKEMDAIFWKEAYGDRDALLAGIEDPALRRLAQINYGPWDRLDGDRPFVPGVGPKPPGASFYPEGVAKAEIEAAGLVDPYSIVRRGDDGKLKEIPYHEAFADHVDRAASLLADAAKLADDPGLKRYLEARSAALLSDDYRPSDLAWMDMKSNVVDVVIGPIENYEDKLLGVRTAHEGYVLVKDKDWSARLARYAALLPALQKGLPVPEAYKAETPGTDSDLNAYDVLFYAGDCNAGAKTIAINLPNDEVVQREKGSRRLQLKNAMRAKFDAILVPIANVVISPDQRENVKFDSFFQNVMFHEVAHGLGIKLTLDGKGTVREALKEQYGALEEGKADVLGLYMVTKLHEMGELPDANLLDNYVTFAAGLFRSVRFGASDAHGRANLAEFGFLSERGAFSRQADGTWKVDFDKMKAAVDALAEKMLRLQGDGDYEGTLVFLPKGAEPEGALAESLKAVAAAGIPKDIVTRPPA